MGLEAATLRRRRQWARENEGESIREDEVLHCLTKKKSNLISKPQIAHTPNHLNTSKGEIEKNEKM